MNSFGFNPNAVEFVPKFFGSIEINPVVVGVEVSSRSNEEVIRHSHHKHRKRNVVMSSINVCDNEKKNTKKKNDKGNKKCKPKRQQPDSICESKENDKQADIFVSPYLSAILKPAVTQMDLKPIETESSLSLSEQSLQSVDSKQKEYKLTNRNRVEKTVSENTLRKLNPKWMEISQRIAEKEKNNSQLQNNTQLLSSVSTTKMELGGNESNRWHSILKVPLPPSQFYELPTNQSNNTIDHKANLVSTKDTDNHVCSEELVNKWWEAVATGNFDNIAYCLEHGIDWEIRYDPQCHYHPSIECLANCQGMTVLHIFFKLCHAPLCIQRILMTFPFIGKHLDLKDRSHKRTILHYLCEVGSIEHFHLVLQSHAQIVCTLLIEKDRYGDTPLHLACKHNHVQLTLHLLEKMKKADCLKINIRNKKGQNAMLCTTSATILGILLEYGGDVLTKDEQGLDVLLLAILQNDALRLRKVLAHNAFRLLMNEEQVRLSGNSVFTYETNMQYYSTVCTVAIDDLSMEVQVTLVRKKICKPQQATIRLTSSPLHLAVLLGHTECIKALLSSGYYPINGIVYDTHRKIDYTPLMYAMLSPAKFEILTLLLQASAEVGRYNEYQLTEIGIAIFEQEYEIIYALSQYLKQPATSKTYSISNQMKLFSISSTSPTQEDNITVILRYLLARFRKTVIDSNVEYYQRSPSTCSEFNEHLGLTVEQQRQFCLQIHEEYLPSFVIAIACGNVNVGKLFWEIICSPIAYENLQSLGLIEDWSLALPKATTSKSNNAPPPNLTKGVNYSTADDKSSTTSPASLKPTRKIALHQVQSIGDVFPHLFDSIDAFLATNFLSKWSQETCDVFITIQDDNTNDRYLSIHRSVLQMQSSVVKQLLQTDNSTLSITCDHLSITLTQVLIPSSAKIYTSDAIHCNSNHLSDVYSDRINASSFCILIRNHSLSPVRSSSGRSTITNENKFSPRISFETLQQIIEYCYTGYLSCLSLVSSIVGPEEKHSDLLEQICAIYQLGKTLDLPKQFLVMCELKIAFLLSKFIEKKQTGWQGIKEWMLNTVDKSSPFYDYIAKKGSLSQPKSISELTPTIQSNLQKKTYLFYFQGLETTSTEDDTPPSSSSMNNKTQDNLITWNELIATLLQQRHDNHNEHPIPYITCQILPITNELQVSVEVIPYENEGLWRLLTSQHQQNNNNVNDVYYPSLNRSGDYYVHKEIEHLEQQIRGCLSNPFKKPPNDSNKQLKEHEWSLHWKSFAPLMHQASHSTGDTFFPTMIASQKRSQVIVSLLPVLLEEYIAYATHRMQWWCYPMKYETDVLISTVNAMSEDSVSLVVMCQENKIGNTVYAVHRDVLIANSPKFHAMITFQASHQQQTLLSFPSHPSSSTILTLSIPDSSSFLMGQMLYFMYTGQIDIVAMEHHAIFLVKQQQQQQQHVTNSDCNTDEMEEESYRMELYLQLATLADDYLISTLTKQATLHVLKTLSIENVNHYYQYACQTRLVLLQQVTAMFLLRMLNISCTTPMEELVDIGAIKESDGGEQGSSKKPELSNELKEVLFSLIDSIALSI